jgi:hypothetical protein
MILTGYSAQAAEKGVRAKIGIEIRSGQEMVQAKSREVVRPGDLIRIYVHPKESAYVYVVYIEEKRASLLNMTMQKIGESTLCLPSAHTYYKVDGTIPIERFAVICSLEDLPELSGMIESDMPREQWSAIEKDLVKENSIVLTQAPEPIIEIAGNVRGNDNINRLDLFVDNLPVFSGKRLLIKAYEFKIQK